MNTDLREWDKLLSVLDWILTVKVRHTDSLYFSLMVISFGDMVKLGNAYGAPIAMQMLLDLAEDLRKTLRKCDIVARDGTDFWVLIPHLQAESVLPKVATIVEAASENGLDIVDHEVAVFSVDDHHSVNDQRFDSTEAFLKYVRINRNIARSWASVP